MNKKQIQQILSDYSLWLQGKGGRRADLTGADLSGIDLSGANFVGANLSKANLSKANLSKANLTRSCLSAADLSGADLTNVNLSGADLTNVNLSGANFYGTNLSGADLSKANLASIKEDVWRVLASAPNEVRAVRAALVEGRVNGGLYAGECACLVGTIANARGVPYQDLDPDFTSPAERWFLPIQKGDTPSKSQFSKITLEWVDEWIAKGSVPLEKNVELMELADWVLALIDPRPTSHTLWGTTFHTSCLFVQANGRLPNEEDVLPTPPATSVAYNVVVRVEPASIQGDVFLLHTVSQELNLLVTTECDDFLVLAMDCAPEQDRDDIYKRLKDYEGQVVRITRGEEPSTAVIHV